ncbi:MAG: FAD-dependent oxidoreductase [bacterium]|nr:FAD-dependent oxidoreductase [bacterium]
MDNSEMKVIVIGASAAGLKAACRLRRLKPEAEVIVIEKGEYISYAACGLPYFLSGDINKFDDLRTTPYELLKDPEYFSTIKDVDVRIQTEALKIDRENHKILYRSITDNKEYELDYDHLVIASGSYPVIPDIIGKDLQGVHTFTHAEDAIVLRKACETGQIGKVGIIGAGYIGIELSEAFLSLWGINVTLFEARENILPEILDTEIALAIEKMLKNEGVEIRTGAGCESIIRKDDILTVKTSSGETTEGFDRIIICAGVRPNTKLAADAGLNIGAKHGIIVNEYLQTSDPNIYAAGDCIEVKHKLTDKTVNIPLGSLANRMGRAVGENIAGIPRKFEPVLGSSIIKAFDWNIGSTGLNITKAEEAGFNAGEVWGYFEDKAHYYPEPLSFMMKLVFDTKTKKVLGIQAVGEGDVIRRIDSMAALLQYDAMLDDIVNFEPAYAPPYGGPIDPLHYLAYTAEAVIALRAYILHPESIYTYKKEDTAILDVRSADEIETNPLPDTIEEKYSIPLQMLRSKVNELQADKNYMIVCQKGIRSYEAALILKESGIMNASFVGGGMLFANIFKD